jgi:hypothetical protein
VLGCERCTVFHSAERGTPATTENVAAQLKSNWGVSDALAWRGGSSRSSKSLTPPSLIPIESRHLRKESTRDDQAMYTQPHHAISKREPTSPTLNEMVKIRSSARIAVGAHLYHSRVCMRTNSNIVKATDSYESKISTSTSTPPSRQDSVAVVVVAGANPHGSPPLRRLNSRARSVNKQPSRIPFLFLYNFSQLNSC